jgi:hypothetical protein
MRWTVAIVLRPITFVLAIVAAVIVGNRTDSFWLGLLAFFIAMGAGRVLGALIRNRSDRAVAKAVWPAGATFFAWLFHWELDLAAWATFFLAWICASVTRQAVPTPRPRWYRRVSWTTIDLDELLP